jgi:hypothetical protein
MLDALLRKGVVHLLAILFLGFIAYSNTFNSPFHFDDIGSIVKNPIIKDLGYFIEPEMAEGLEFHNSLKKRYVGYLTFALNYGVHGLNVTGYHVVNLAIHITNAFLVYFLIVLAFDTPFLETSQLRTYARHIALISALLFVSHPVQTQAVTFIVQRLTSLATMFYLASLLSYIKSRLTVQGTGRYILYSASLIFAVLAMKTKEIAITLPFVIALFEFSFFPSSLPHAADGGNRTRRALFLIPFFVTMLVILLTFIGTSMPLSEMFGDIAEVEGVEDISRHDYMLTELRVVVTYLRLLVLPVGQNLDYDYTVFKSFFDPQVILSFLFLLSVLGVGVYFHLRSTVTDHALRLVSFGICWFFITLSVESGIIPLHVIYEHRVYLPSSGFFIAFVSGVFILLRRSLAAGNLLPVLVLVFLSLPLSAASYARNSIWKDGFSLWEDVIKKSPRKARGYNNLGNRYSEKDIYKKALKYYEIAVSLDPQNALYQDNLGIAYGFSGKVDEAIKHFLLAVKIQPDLYEAHNNLGYAYLNKGMVKAAVRHFKIALSIKPDYSVALDNLKYAERLGASGKE